MKSHRLFKFIGFFAILLLLVPALIACSSGGTKATDTPAVEVPKPSNPGGTGQAVSLTGDAAAGQQVFATTCTPCHGDQGKGGVQNPGSSDGTIPALNPIDPGLVSADQKTFASNIDLFIEHGSTPGGTKPAQSMPAFGDQKTLTPQQIADVMAYVISLNKK